MRLQPSYRTVAPSASAFPVLLAACFAPVPALSAPDLPVTEQGRPFQVDNERMRGSAPPVAQALTVMPHGVV